MAHQLNKTLKSCSWQDLYAMYRAFGDTLELYKRINIPKSIDIKLTDKENLFIIRARKDINRIDEHLYLLDREIARRNKLVCVV